MEKFTTTSQTLQSDKYANMKWHNYLTLDVFIKVFNQTLLHPFVAWIVVLCLRAQVTPYEHPSMIIAISWASILTVLAGLKYINERIAYGTPREVDLSREVIVVTGGGSGLGQLIAQIYGMRGASVAVVDVKEVSEVEGWDELSGVEYYQCDVGDRKALELTASRIQNDVGHPLSHYYSYFLHLRQHDTFCTRFTKMRNMIARQAKCNYQLCGSRDTPTKFPRSVVECDDGNDPNESPRPFPHKSNLPPRNHGL